MSLQLRPKHGKFKCGAVELKATQKVVVGPFQEVMVPMIAATELETSTFITAATPSFARIPHLNVTPALSQLHDGRTTIHVTKSYTHTFIISQGTIVIMFDIITPEQTSHVHPMSLEQLALVSTYPDEATNFINQLFQSPEEPKLEKRWYPTPETCEDPIHLNDIERRIYDELLKLCELEKLDPKVDDDQRRALLDKISSENFQLPPEKQAMVERFLVKYHRIFARQRLDIGFHNDFRIKLTPKHDEPVYAQSLPTPTNFKDEEMLVELALQL